MTYQDGPYDLLAPTFNLNTYRTDSTVIYGELKSPVVHLASETIHQTLFMVLVPGYSIEPHNVLNHIWQCYITNDGKPVVLTAQVYYIRFTISKNTPSIWPAFFKIISTFVSGIMKIHLCFGFCHTIVLDKDSKFFGEFKEAVDLLQINCHVLSGGNHNPMLVERVNRYLNKGLKIMTNERDSVRVAMEAILLLLYAWTSAPIPGTDLSRSFVALGREFQFPIDFSTNKHFELTSTPSTIASYSRNLASHLSALRDVASLLVKEQRARHCEFVNARRPDPKLFAIGDIVFARRAVRSDASGGVVDKLTYPFTGPWQIIAKLKGASYKIEHCTSKTKDKCHASDLSPYPVKLIPFQPIDGADNQFGQLYCKIKEHPYKEAGINGFTPPTPFVAPSTFITASDALRFTWPTLAELNEDILGSDDSIDDDDLLDTGDSLITTPSLYTGPPPSAPTCSIPSVPSANSLAQRIITSADKLFFISHKIGGSDDDVREWRLVRIAFRATTSSYPSCLDDGKYIVKFFISHPADCRYNAANQRFWLQYHNQSELLGQCSSSNTHLIRPSDTSEAYALRHKLLPFCHYTNLTHSDTFIHGPFDFATVNGRKSRDRIDQADWGILRSRTTMFHNPIPSVKILTYSVHVDACAHTTFQNSAFHAMHLSTCTMCQNQNTCSYILDKRSSMIYLQPPPFFFLIFFSFLVPLGYDGYFDLVRRFFRSLFSPLPSMESIMQRLSSHGPFNIEHT